MATTIVWDNDGVLVDTERLYYQATYETLARHGFALDQESYREHFLASSRGTWHLLVEQGVTEARVASLRSERDDRYESLIRSEAIEVEGAAQVLEALSGSHRMAVATSSKARHFHAIHERTGFLSYFEHVVTSDEVHASKPDPALYLEAVDRLGVSPARCVAFEDSERGLQAAKGAGLRCWVLPSALSRGADWSLADGVLDSILEVPAVLAELG